MASRETCRTELRSAVRHLSDRGLYSAAKWAAERLMGIEQDPSKQPPSHTRLQRGSSSIRRRFRSGTPSPPGASHMSTHRPCWKISMLTRRIPIFIYWQSLTLTALATGGQPRVLREQTSKKAVFLRCYALYLPNDSRLWVAMAQCYETEQLHMLDEAVKCYERAANCSDREATALHQLVNLHSDLGRAEDSAFYYRKDLERMEADEREGPNMVETLMFLAQHCKTGKFDEADVYCTRLLDYTGPEKETAKSLLRGIRHARDIEHFLP